MALLSSARRTTTLAPPLPIANKVLSSTGIVLRRGQFSILAAAPGVGKSLFANNLAVFTPTPSLFFSADSDEFTVKLRTISILTGQALAQVDANLNSEAWENEYNKILCRADHVDWCFNVDIDTEFMALRLAAYAELRGDFPQLIIVDNLGNTVDSDSDEYAQLRATCRELQRMARNTGAHIMALHHVKGDKEDGFKPVTLGSLLGNLGKIPETVLGLCRAGENAVTVSVPKQRGGKSNFTFNLGLDYPTATVGGYR